MSTVKKNKYVNPVTYNISESNNDTLRIFFEETILCISSPINFCLVSYISRPVLA